jgi:1-acyl-sn-glycerol-3-phosphate acyltransferase
MPDAPAPIELRLPEQESWYGLLGRVIFGVYAWIVFVVIALITLLALLLIPDMLARRRAASIAAKASLRCMFMRLQVEGLAQLPVGQCVVAANHASYIDAIVIKAVLPERFAYVVKREMAEVPLAGLLLKRLGTEFVERFNPHKGALDARRVLRTASSGQPLLFFPEGTFIERPGLLKFHSGAFRSAASAGCPIVPCVLRGTRHILSSARWFPRPGRIQVQILAPVTVPEGLEPERATRLLREETRARILEQLGEPDLAG